ncbi:MAG: MMPL family transporter, partial [Planctomycetota bacterium]
LSRGGGLDVRDALREAVAVTGSAISVDTLAVCLGFGILMLSQVPANARLGGLLVLSLVNCFAATILILPAILSLRRGRRSA